jgi:hypothetical protein
LLNCSVASVNKGSLLMSNAVIATQQSPYAG